MNSSTMKPIIAVDVDGVLNPSAYEALRHGYTQHTYEGYDPYGEYVNMNVWLNPAHGIWLNSLEAKDVEMVWCTAWSNLARTWLAPRLELSTSWHVINTHGKSGVRWGHNLKLEYLYAYAGQRPVAIIDDEFGGKDFYVAENRTMRGSPTLLIHVNLITGLTHNDIDCVTSWLDSI